MKQRVSSFKIDFIDIFFNDGIIFIFSFYLCQLKPAVLLHAKNQSPDIIAYSPNENVTRWMSLCTSLTICILEKRFTVMLAVKLETTHKPSKPPTNHPNHPQTNQITHISATSPTDHPQTSQMLDKPPTNQPKITSVFPWSHFL